MGRIKCVISYDGTNFSGYQVQPKKRTVQSEIERALQKMHKGQEIKVFASGRTDSKVHAVGQVIHFDTALGIPIERWKQALNALFPNDIRVISAEHVHHDFHARFDVKAKEYRYKVFLPQDNCVFKRHYSYHFPYSIDVASMKKATSHLIGTHDFSSFCAANTEVKDKIRTIYQIKIEERNGELLFSFIGNGFLYNMVRILVGTLLEVGSGRTEPDAVQTILAKRNRTFAGKTAPGQGLYLWKVYYQDWSGEDYVI